MESKQKKKRHKRLYAIPENSRPTLGSTTLQSEPQIPLHPNRKRNRRLNRWMWKKGSTFLQLLKETAMRCGGAKRLDWTDIDFQKTSSPLTTPRKAATHACGKPRQNSLACSTICRDKANVYSEADP
jgi:hypothetical protein